MSGGVGPRILQMLEGAAGRVQTHDPDPVLALARQFGIAGYVRRVRRSAGERNARLATRFAEVLMLEAATDLSARLRRNGVDHFVAKGIGLVGQVYRPGDRQMADIDLYVRPEGSRAARAVLRSAGYRELPSREQSGPEALRPGVALVRDGARCDAEAIAVDLHWGLEPVEYLLPRSELAIPRSLWGRLRAYHGVPVPSAEEHAALIVHHLVHHDLLHAKSVVDLALLRERAWDAGGRRYAGVARALGVVRVARAVEAMLVARFGFAPLPGIGRAPGGWAGRRLRRLLQPERLFARAARAEAREHRAITPGRIARRMLLLDRARGSARLLQDVVHPPEEHLRWRWPAEASIGAAWRRHLRSLGPKLVGQ